VNTKLPPQTHIPTTDETSGLPAIGIDAANACAPTHYTPRDAGEKSAAHGADHSTEAFVVLARHSARDATTNAHSGEALGNLIAEDAADACTTAYLRGPPTFCRDSGPVPRALRPAPTRTGTASAPPST
jgi:hypothetical protein